MELQSVLKTNRPHLGESSIKTYTSILKNLFLKVYGDAEMTMDRFKDSSKLLTHLKDVPANKRKTILSALVVLTNEDKYRHVMMDDVSSYNTEIAKQETTPAQDKSWVHSDDISGVLRDLKMTADMLYKKAHLSAADLQKIQDYIMICVLGGIYIPPRRALDYCCFKIRSIDKDVDNYIDGSKFVFTQYKTAKTYGKQMVDIPKELKTILNKWIKINPTEWLLFDTHENPLNSVKLNQRLSKIFKGISTGTSVNALRHSYLTTKYGSTIQQKKAIDKDMSEMGSSAGMLSTYVKDV